MTEDERNRLVTLKQRRLVDRGSRHQRTNLAMARAICQALYLAIDVCGCGPCAEGNLVSQTAQWS